MWTFSTINVELGNISFTFWILILLIISVFLLFAEIWHAICMLFGRKVKKRKQYEKIFSRFSGSGIRFYFGSCRRYQVKERS